MQLEAKPSFHMAYSIIPSNVQLLRHHLVSVKLLLHMDIILEDFCKLAS
jgi:hypothetical protein